MPFPDSNYPSILRGKDKRESQRLLAAAPRMLAACRLALIELDKWSHIAGSGETLAIRGCQEAIAKAEGRE